MVKDKVKDKVSIRKIDKQLRFFAVNRYFNSDLKSDDFMKLHY